MNVLKIKFLELVYQNMFTVTLCCTLYVFGISKNNDI